VAQVTARAVEDGLTAFEVRPQQNRDVREAISQRLAKNGWPIRKLDLRRRRLQDRWNEINNMDESLLGRTPVTVEGRPPRPGSTAVTPTA
jgi:hypothetical protein